MSPKPMFWDAATDRKLFFGAYVTQNITINYEKAANYMSSNGQVVTVDAIKGRIKLLKAMAKEKAGNDATAGGDNGTQKPKASHKRTTGAADGASPAKKGKTTKGKGKKVEDADNVEETGAQEENVKEEDSDYVLL